MITDETRGDELLHRIKTVFVAKGFEGASMQDLAGAAGMSAGNFYRYFPSKDAIIQAFIEREHEQLEAAFATVMRAADPRRVLLSLIEEHIEEAERDGPLWAEIDALAARRADVADLIMGFHQTILRHLLAAFGRISGLDDLAVADRYSTHAALLMILVQSGVVSGCGVNARLTMVDVEALKRLVMRQIDGLLDEIAAGCAIPLET